MKIIYPAILTPCTNKDGYTIVIPDLKGCVSEGDTLEEAVVCDTSIYDEKYSKKVVREVINDF